MSDIKLNDLEKGSTSSKDEELYLGEESTGQQSDVKLNMFVRFFNMLNAQDRGIERVLEHERNPNEGVLTAASMWFSANMVLASLVLGFLGQSIFGLTFWTSVLTIIFFNILGLIPVAFFSTFGPEFGLRQMVVSRFLIGDLTVRIIAFITAIACIGWGAVNTMASAQMLNLVNVPHSLPPWAGCLIIVVLTIVVTLFGYKTVHLYEKYSWIPNVAVFFVLIARLKISGNFTPGHMVGGTDTAAGVLSFGGTIFGFATGWATYAADYTVYIRHDYPRWKLFAGVSIGLFIPLMFTMILGAAIITGIAVDETWAYYYDNYQSGGLLFCVLSVDSLGGFGQFCSVVLALSTVANNIPNMYTIAFCTQTFWSPLAKVPRFVWTVIGNFLTLAICIPAYYDFSDVMSDFMDLIGYYLAIYEAISLSEHFIYKKGFKGYDIEGWNDKSRYPKGYAGTLAFCFGVFGAVMGMDQVWYVGKIAEKIGTYGGDIGFELAGAFAFIAYNVARPFEIKYTGR